LEEKLPAEDVQTLEELLDLCLDSSVMESYASFEYGFKIGALIMLEVLDGRKELNGRED
jgi:hypothetical protein